MNKLKFFVFLPAILALVFMSPVLMGQPSPEKKGNDEKWIPKLEDRVTDLGKVLTKNQRRSMTEMLADYEKETTHQIVVLTIPTLNGEAIEDFSLRTANAWGIGHRGLDNGILVTVVIDERKVRIELGLGLEKFISDELAGEIIKTVMVPHFKKNNYAEGIDAGLRSLMKAARKYVVPESQHAAGPALHGPPAARGPALHGPGVFRCFEPHLKPLEGARATCPPEACMQLDPAAGGP